MSTRFASPAIDQCPVCHGTGFDEAFASPCNCHANLTPSARAAAIRDQLGDDRVTVGMPHGNGTPGPARPDRFANIYAGKCVECTQWVPAQGGIRVRVGQLWGVRHNIGECAAPCTECGGWVLRGHGRARRTETGEMLVRHLQCPQAAPVAVAPTQTVHTAGLDLSALPRTGPSTFFGVPGAGTRLKVRVSASMGKWEGWFFVDDGAQYGYGTKYGRQAPGKTYVGEIEDELRAILADPEAALRKYAELTGHCGICNRPLEDEVSVARGVGPVCWGRIHG